MADWNAAFAAFHHWQLSGCPVSVLTKVVLGGNFEFFWRKFISYLATIKDYFFRGVRCGGEESGNVRYDGTVSTTSVWLPIEAIHPAKLRLDKWSRCQRKMQ